jgi:hypothetical protein
MARTPRTIRDVLGDLNMTAFLSLASLLWAPAVLAPALASACTAALVRRPLPAPGCPEAPDRRQLGSSYPLIEHYRTDEICQE